jgi:XapX domain-containing protein
VKGALGLLLAAVIGVACRLADIPLPAPPALIGALLVLAMTLGYVATDRLAVHRQPKSEGQGRGPSGQVKEERT